jgi:hypothetical protein
LGAGVVCQAPDADAASERRKKVIRGDRRPAAVPEIPIAGAAAALTLILGGTAIALDRRRRKSK